MPQGSHLQAQKAYRSGLLSLRYKGPTITCHKGLTSRPKKRAIAGCGAVGFALVFSVTAGREGLLAVSALQAKGMPVFSQRRFALSWKIFKII